MGKGMQETNERSRQESGNVETIVPPPQDSAGWVGGGGGSGGVRTHRKGGEMGCEKSHLRGSVASRVRHVPRCVPCASFWTRVHAAAHAGHIAASAYRCHLVFLSRPLHRMYRVKGSEMETTKDSLRQCSPVLVPAPFPLPHLVPPTFLIPPLLLLSLFSLPSPFLTFHHPLFHPPSPACPCSSSRI